MISGVTRRGFLAVAGTAAVAGAAAGADAPAGGRIRIIGIATSLRKGKTTAAAVQAALDAAKALSPSIEVELIELAGLQLHPEVAAGVPLAEGQVDDFPKIQAKLADPAVLGIIIGSPVYFGNMSSLCKAFLERCMAFRREFGLRNKVAGCVAVGAGRNGGQELTLQSIRAALTSQDMIVMGDGRPTSHWGGTLWNNAKDDIAQDEMGMATAKNTGRRVAEMALRMAGIRVG